MSHVGIGVGTNEALIFTFTTMEYMDNWEKIFSVFRYPPCGSYVQLTARITSAYGMHHKLRVKSQQRINAKNHNILVSILGPKNIGHELNRILRREKKVERRKGRD